MKQEDEEEREVMGEKTFGKSTRGLLHRLPSTMAQNLSVALAFSALLHLANEKVGAGGDSQGRRTPALEERGLFRLSFQLQLSS
ncbi:UNVERIFIED_CONTAM: hypothetical protein FKN15_072135 [Acipenser sinensis]